MIVPSIVTAVFFEHVAAEADGAVATVKEIATVDATRAAPNFANFFICFLSKGVTRRTRARRVLGQKLPLIWASVKAYLVTLSVINMALLQFFAVLLERDQGQNRV